MFEQDGVVYRQVNQVFADDYDEFIRSGLYADLVGPGLLVEHEEVPVRPEAAPEAHAVLRPERVPFISYPYEWCHGQLKDAALLTLELQRRAVSRGFVLRDASAYNVQFVRGRPVWIDTLSFGRLVEGEPWGGYRQFCQHFLAPLALVSRVGASLGRLSAIHIDGVPLDQAVALLPAHARLRPGLLAHLYLHARSIARVGSATHSPRGHVRQRKGSITRAALLAFVDSLESTIRGLTWNPGGSWTHYAANTNYSPAAARHKQELVTRLLREAAAAEPVSMVWDLGGNIGVYGQLAADLGARVVVMDADAGAIERLYRDRRSRGDTQILPLVQDLTNPSAGTGWRNAERRSLLERGPADLVLGLALVHHLAISNNVPFADIAAFLHAVARWAIVEFVDRKDSQVQRMLSTRGAVFSSYDQDAFERALSARFTILARHAIDDSARTLYLLRAVPTGAGSRTPGPGA